MFENAVSNTKWCKSQFRTKPKQPKLDEKRRNDKMVKGTFKYKMVQEPVSNNGFVVNTQLRLDAKLIFKEEKISFEKMPFSKQNDVKQFPTKIIILLCARTWVLRFDHVDLQFNYRLVIFQSCLLVSYSSYLFSMI